MDHRLHVNINDDNSNERGHMLKLSRISEHYSQDDSADVYSKEKLKSKSSKSKSSKSNLNNHSDFTPDATFRKNFEFSIPSLNLL